MITWYWVEDYALEAWHADQQLLRYVYRPDVPATDSPRPYFHPLRALDGTAITDFAPDDHRWHLGLSLALPYVSGSSFWGGPTYVHGQGYVLLPNHGKVEHRAWDTEQPDSLTEHLDWINEDGQIILREQRTIRAEVLSGKQWALMLDMTLHNQTDNALEFVSPAGFGRTGAGYGGLFWRGSEQMLNGSVSSAQHNSENAVQGTRSQWLTYQAADGSIRLHFSALPHSADYPPCWFVRASEYPGVCFALAFEDRYLLPAGERVQLAYRITIENIGE